MPKQIASLANFGDGSFGLLSGVWFTTETITDDDAWNKDESANVCYFMWQGEIYRAQEDPNDGYRSSLGPFHVLSKVMPYDVWDPSERCMIRYRQEVEHDADDHWRSPEKCDLIEFVSVITEKVVLTIGTTNTDDYYPSCVLHFDPRNLSHNQPTIDLLGRERKQ
jgi:hypothetical protein